MGGWTGHSNRVSVTNFMQRRPHNARMARAGRPADPAPLKLLKGRSPGKDCAGRDVPEVPAFVREAPDVPDWLSVDAADLWRRIAPGLDELGLLKPEDFPAFAILCETWSRYCAA